MPENTGRYESAVARYFEAWNAREPQARAKAVAVAWAADGGYTDPLADGSAPVAGSDVVTLDGEGRIKAVLGFLDRVPTGA